MMKLQENSKQLSFLIICFSQKLTFEVLSANLKTLTANKLYFLVQLVIRGVRPNPTNPPWIRPCIGSVKVGGVNSLRGRRICLLDVVITVLKLR